MVRSKEFPSGIPNSLLFTIFTVLAGELGKKPLEVEIAEDGFIDNVGGSLVTKIGNRRCHLFISL